MSIFFSNEQVSLEKNVSTKVLIQNSVEKIHDLYEIDRCVQWVKTNNFKRVCLQFPDHLLPDSVEVAFKLQNVLDQPVYILGDTAYESCCLDFIAAGHVEADAIIHFGAICFSQNMKKLPFLNIFEKYDIDLEYFINAIEAFVSEKEKTEVYLLVDTPYIHFIDFIDKSVEKLSCVTVLRLDGDVDYSKDGLYIFLGNNNRKMENILFSLDEFSLYQYDPESLKREVINFKENPLVLKRRYYLVEKIKDSRIFGIVMGTLAVDNYLKVLSRIKKLLKLNGKKYYVLSVGKISVAKLANFPEMDMFIVITCAMNEVYDSKEFYKPIVTPFDVEKAFNPNSQSLKFTYDYNSFLMKACDDSELKPSDQPDVSLLTGKMRSNRIEDSDENIQEGKEVAVKTNGVLVECENFGAGYLANRSWKGLEQNFGETKVEKVREGRSGIAQGYSNEVADSNNT